LPFIKGSLKKEHVKHLEKNLQFSGGKRWAMESLETVAST
jgi:hypothetical protein